MLEASKMDQIQDCLRARNRSAFGIFFISSGQQTFSMTVSHGNSE